MKPAKLKKTFDLLQMLIFLISLKLIFACSPGPRFGDRRLSHKLNPLLRGQFIPAVSEVTIGASGPAETPIQRDTPEFSKLVMNVNPEIVFINERNDESKRMMTQRCKDRVNVLATLVMNRWGVRLRVLKAWSSDIGGPKGSLHYEGRAVDIITDDSDIKKNGMLARLAVEAGFDWVHFKTKFFVHASVRPDDSASATYGGCFPASSTVLSKNNKSVLMENLSVGDQILAVDRYTGQLVYSDVIMLMDKQINVSAQFLEITTASSTVTLTRNHMIYIINPLRTQFSSNLSLRSFWSDSAYPVFAEDVEIGQKIFIGNYSNLFPIFSTVISIRKVVEKGVVAPLTKHGTIIVHNVVASCYGVFESERLAHAVFAPARSFKLFRKTYEKTSGMHWYTRFLSQIAKYLIPKNFFRIA